MHLITIAICYSTALKGEELAFRPQYATVPQTLPGGE